MKQFIKARAAWVDGTHLCRDVVVCIEDGTIRDVLCDHQVSLDPSQAAVSEEQLLLPGFINAHAHLEYSFCRGRLPRGNVLFADWIDAIGELKRSTASDDFVEAATAGIRELLEGGCTTVVDCAHREEMATLWAQSPLRHLILWELIALFDDQADAVWADAQRRLAQPKAGRCIAHGLNPHAPYSVGPRLRSHLRDFARHSARAPIGWHVAETEEEVELFEKGTGPFAQFAVRHNIPRAFEEVPHCSPVEFLRREQLLDSCDYLFHFNHFSRHEARSLTRDQAVVHCPTTHTWFERPPFDVMTLLREGINVCLGTDSLATADTLSMFDVMRMAAREFPSLTAAQLLNMLTKNPARTAALRRAAPPLGMIARNCAADFAALSTPLSLDADLRDILTHPETAMRATYVSGEKVCERA